MSINYTILLWIASILPLGVEAAQDNDLESQLRARGERLKKKKSQMNFDRLPTWKEPKHKFGTIDGIKDQNAEERVLKIAKEGIKEGLKPLSKQLDEASHRLAEIRKEQSSSFGQHIQSSKRKQNDNDDEQQLFLHSLLMSELIMRAEALKKYEEKQKAKQRRKLEREKAKIAQNKQTTLNQSHVVEEKIKKRQAFLDQIKLTANSKAKTREAQERLKEAQEKLRKKQEAEARRQAIEQNRRNHPPSSPNPLHHSLSDNNRALHTRIPFSQIWTDIPCLGVFIIGVVIVWLK